MPIRIALVDDSPIFQAAVAHFLQHLPGVLVVGRAACGADGLSMVAATLPDLVLLDIGLPDISGIEVGRKLQAWAKPPQIVFLSMGEVSALERRVLGLGTARYVHKSNFVSELVPIVESLTTRSAGPTRP